MGRAKGGNDDQSFFLGSVTGDDDTLSISYSLLFLFHRLAMITSLPGTDHQLITF